MLTRSVLDAVCEIAPLVPVTVNDNAHGTVLVVVFIVRVDVPDPLIVGGLNPPLVIPVGNPDSLPTLSVTGPVKPLTGETVTVNVTLPPGATTCALGAATTEKSGVVGVTVIVRVGGLGSEFPLASMAVNDT
jgi:hypothetical protein